MIHNYIVISLFIIILCLVLLIIYKKITQSKITHSTQQTAKAMVLTCMDYRLVDDAVYAMIQKGYLNNYDEFVLAGASLGYINNDRWRNAFDDHVILAIKLHQINEIIVIDHRDCGYYKSIYGSDVIKQADRNKETMHHKTNIYKFKWN